MACLWRGAVNAALTAATPGSTVGVTAPEDGPEPVLPASRTGEPPWPAASCAVNSCTCRCSALTWDCAAMRARCRTLCSLVRGLGVLAALRGVAVGLATESTLFAAGPASSMGRQASCRRWHRSWTHCTASPCQASDVSCVGSTRPGVRASEAPGVPAQAGEACRGCWARPLLAESAKA